MANLQRDYLDVPSDPDKLTLLTDPRDFDKQVDTDRLAVVVEQRGQTAPTRADDAGARGLSLEEYDDELTAEWEELSARLEIYGMSNKVINLTVRDGKWMSPASVESFCGETSTNVAANSIDGDTGTHWRHVTNERHSIVYKLRDFPLRVERIRFFYNASLPVNEQLENLDVHMAKALVNIDDPDNILETGINITWPGTGGVFVEHTLATPKASAVYIKLLFDTASAINTGQIREFEVFCTPKKAG